MTGLAAFGSDDPKPGPSVVVMKSIDTKLLVDGRVVDPRGEFFHYRVENVNGDWLWLVSEVGIRGWARRQDVVPVGGAIDYFSEAIAREPRSARAHYMRGLAHLEAAEYRQAIHDLGAAIRLDPGYGPAYVDRGHARIEKHDLKGVLADADQAIRLDPDRRGLSPARLCRAEEAALR